MSNSTMSQCLHQYQLDKVLPSDVWPHLHLVHFKAGEVICAQGESASQMYFLVEGKIRVSHMAATGKRLVLSFKQPLDLIGDIEYIQRSPLLNTVEAVTSVQMIRVHFMDLATYATDDVKWLQFLLDEITRKFEMKSQAMSFNLFYPVDVRLASYLLSMTPHEATLQATLADLTDVADLIGTSYRHVNRTLKRFAEEGLITRQKGSVTLVDRQGLLDVVGESIYE